MKTFAALTLSATVLFAAAPVQANPLTEAMQQLAANQLAEIKVTVVQQARQAMEKTAVELRQWVQSEPQLGQHQAEKTDTKPVAE